MNGMKKFAKEMKRVKWVKGKKMGTILGTTLLFVIIAGMLLGSVELGFTTLGAKMGIGL